MQFQLGSILDNTFRYPHRDKSSGFAVIENKMLKIWTIFVLLLQLSSLIDGKSLEIASYARVARNGDASSHEVDTKQQHQDPAEMYNSEIRNQFPPPV